MENVQQKSRGHPLAAGAVAAVMVAAAVAAAAIGGILPGSRAEQKQPVVKAKLAPVVAAACAECGVVVSVKEETVMGKGSGFGAVAGGVAGAVLGHEIGDGSDAGTAVGAVVGGVAGHQIERSAGSTKKYTTSVRLPDGSVKTAFTDTRPAWRAGDKVRLHKGVVKPL